MTEPLSLARPFPAWLPAAGYAADVVTPPLGGMTVEQLAELSAASEHSFIHVAAAELDALGVPADGHPAMAARPAAGAVKLRSMIESGVLERVDDDAFYVYEITTLHGSIVGLVCEVAVEAYDDGRILRHESTREGTEALLESFLEDLRVHADPIALAVDTDTTMDALVEQVMALPAIREFSTRAPRGNADVRHRVWKVPPEIEHALQGLLAPVDRLYITDGHHRFAAAARHHRRTGEGVGVLAVLYPSRALSILPFDRVVRMEQSMASVIQRIEASGVGIRVLPVGEDPAPRAPGEVTMVGGGAAYRLRFPNSGYGDPVGRLDVSKLQRYVFDAVLGISDPETDVRVRYVGGHGRRPGPLSDDELAFLLHPTSVRQVMDVADAGLVMPPKSTWFEPKAWGGLFVRLFDD